MKIVYLWRHFSQAAKLQMRCFRGALKYILDAKVKIYASEKTFGDKIAANNEI